MQATARSMRSSVLGKRTHTQSSSEPTSTTGSLCDEGGALPTPDPSPDPKRPRTSTSFLGGDGNKENIPPVVFTVLNRTPTRRVRRSSTECSISPRRTPRRTGSSSSLNVSLRTPSTSFNSLSLSTPPPSPPSALLPLHVRVRALLRATSNTVTGMSGRAEERAVIRCFVASFLTGPKEGHSALYISGTPGTGKTALVNDVLFTCRAELENHNVQTIVINCMALKGVDAIWESVAEFIDEGQVSGRRARKTKETLTQRVRRLLMARMMKAIVVLDELDHAMSDNQCLISLFTTAKTLSDHLRVIGIANTHTLTSSPTTTALQTVEFVKTIHFAPYVPQQLMDILTCRLSSLYSDVDCCDRVKSFLPASALTLLTKKVACQTGDVRVVFEVLRGAIDFALDDAKSEDPLAAPSPVITPGNILAALKAQSSIPRSPAISTSGPSLGLSELVTKVRTLGLHQRLALLALLLASKRADARLPLSASGGSPSPSKLSRSPVKQTRLACATTTNGFVDTAQLYAFYSAVLARGDSAIFTPVSRSEFMDILGLLETVGLVTLSTGRANMPATPSKTGRKGFGRSSSFTTGSGKGSTQEVSFVPDVRLDEVARGLGIVLVNAEVGTSAELREEEVCAIWERERARIAREVKACAHAPVVADIFDGAMEA